MLALLVYGAALVVRLALLPWTEGWDFHSIARLATLTLQGRDVYALTPPQLHVAPWAYFPPCLYLYTSLAWLALHTGWPFLILGKLPVVVADLAVGGLLYRALQQRGQSQPVATLGMALYLFNPLVLYNGAFSGRFDAVALAFLLLALEAYHTRWFAPAYAVAVAVKTFPLFLLPLLLLGRDRQAVSRLGVASGLLAVLALPAIVTDPGGLLHNLLYHARGGLGGKLSVYLIPLAAHWFSPSQGVRVAQAANLLFGVALLSAVRQPLYRKAALCFALFVALAPTVYEQYLLWSLPFLIVVGLQERRLSVLALGGLYTVAGLLENEQTWAVHSPWHYALVPTPWLPLNAALTVSTLVVTGTYLRTRSGSALDPTGAIKERSEPDRGDRWTRTG